MHARVLEIRDVTKSFGAHAVLRGISLTLHAGEVHVLAGENGAGKSTLIKILSGAISDHTGEVRLDDRPLRFRSPIEARRAGVATIYQELSLVLPMSVADNLFLGRERRGHRALARTLLARVGLPGVDVDAKVETLELAAMQLVEIAKSLAEDARVIIMDEPTSALNDREVEALFGRIAALRESGKAILYITHKMEEIRRIADRITVLRDGLVARSATPAELDADGLIAAMLGKELAREVTRPRVACEGDVERPVALEVMCGEVALSVRAGEIVGLTGLQGAGFGEVLRAPFARPREALSRGVVLLPSDRKSHGIVPELSVTENATLTALRDVTWVHEREERAMVASTTDRLQLHAPSLDAAVGTLSGGNQQKVMLARCLLAAPRVMLLDEPTRGVDVGAKADIHRLLRELATQGMAILLTSSELEELLSLCHRIVVMQRGRVAATFAAEHATRENILRASMVPA